MHDPDISISCKAIYSIGKIALDNPFAKDTCVDTLIHILHLEVDYITAKCLQTLQGMLAVLDCLYYTVLFFCFKFIGGTANCLYSVSH